LLALILLVGAPSASAQLNGSIQTTFNTGTTVNGNIYPSKALVYLNGGPQNESSAGLDNGTYYFQVTDPSGAHLLSTDDITCRQVLVVGGRFAGHPAGSAPATCTEPAGSATPGDFHANGLTNSLNGSIPIQLCAPSGCPDAGGPLTSPDFENTDNGGGEYKVWITPIAQYGLNGISAKTNWGFDGATKTDNFKVRPAGTAFAIVTVCKFKDINGDGVQNNGEPLIPHWPITATGVDPTNGNPTTSGTTVSTQTGDNGCVAFTYTPTNAVFPHTITLTEGLLTGWVATAPPDGDCTAALTGTVNPADTCSVNGVGGTITITVNNGDNLSVPDFGNKPPCTSNCNPGSLTVTKTATPALTRTFKWGISKSVDKTEIDTSGSATFNYTVQVTHDSGTDSNWQVTGSIRLGNASLGDVTGITVTDTVDNGGICSVDTTGFGGTVLAGTHVDLPYTCTYANAPSPATGTNTVTASSDQGTFPGSAPFDFASAALTLVDDSVTVTDTFGGTLGTVSSTDPSPTTFTYSHTFNNDPAGSCTTHDNTATFTTDTTSTTGSDGKSVKVCVGADLTVTKTATPAFTRTFKWNINKSADNTVIDTSSGSSVTFNYTVSVTHDGGTDSGWQVTGTITVTNPNNWEAITANVSDSIDNGGNCTVTGGTNVVIAASSSVPLSYTCTYSSQPSPSAFTNKATASWDATAAFTPDSSGLGTATGNFDTPSTLVDNSVTVTDPVGGGTLGTVSSTDPSPTTFKYSRKVTAPSGSCQSYDNTATFTTNTTSTTGSASQTVKVCGASPLTVSKTATPAFTSGISKAVDKTRVNTTSGGSATFNYTITVTESGWNVTGTITVTNPNNWEDITTTNLTDALTDGTATCTVSGGATQTVPKSSSISPTYSCTFSGTPGSASGTNTATATWDATPAHTATNTASGTANYTFGALHVTDSFAGALGTISAPAASTVFTYSRTITAPTATCGTFPNTATITETSQSSNQSVEVCGFSPLTVSKTTATNYNASINKTSGQTSPVEGSGASTLTYTVKVTESGWTVSGNITVKNPNDWESVTVNLADVLSIVGGSCSITGGTTQTVPAAGMISPGYTCTFASAPAASGNNTASASWSGSGSSSGTTFIVAGSASSGAVPFAFQLLNVTDQFNGGTPKTLGSNLVPAASYSFNDSYTVTVTGGTCQAFPNIATLVPVAAAPGIVASITANPTSSSQTVTVCNTATGALTMGFWKNKNGQAIITGGASTGGVCKSGTFLRTYAPFQDLSASATCSQVATYVSNILSSATAAGAAMNAMLKGQMLATALDVYFSDPALGGNKIGAAIPLGGVKIDLTHVCKMIDSSGGTGTCSGSFENSSSAFGGASSGTVSFLLSYAASQSNVGGSIWYGQNKTIQGLAKDTFDEINNQVATIAP